MKKKRIAFIGAGRVTIHHINLLKKLRPYFEIVAICDLIEAKCDEIIKNFELSWGIDQPVCHVLTNPVSLE